MQLVVEQAVVTHSFEDAQDLTGQGQVSVAMETARDTYFAQEPVRLRLFIRIEREFLEKSVIQPFLQHLDVPVQLVAPAFEDLPCTLDLEDGAVATDPELEPGSVRSRASFVLGDELAQASRTRTRASEGRETAVLEIERTFLATCATELVLPAPVVRFSFATRFDEDFVRGRVALDRQDAYVNGTQLTLRIQPLPEEGRPLDFTGAVGHFTIEARADPHVIEVGESLTLLLRIEGQGNLGLFDAPRLDHLDGFETRGSIDDKHPQLRTIAYDLSPTSEAVTQVPPIPFALFDTTSPASYRTLWTQPIPIEVTARSENTVGSAAIADSAPPRSPGTLASTEKAGTRSLVKSCWTILLLSTLMLLLWFFIRHRKPNTTGRMNQ